MTPSAKTKIGTAAAGRLSVAVTVAGLGRLYGGDLARVIETARIADELGIDRILLPDHLAIGPRTDRYPYGRFPLPQDEPWLEPLTALAAVAGATRRIRLGTAVLIAPLRPPLLLAKTAATLDVLSGGRLDLGVGLGWQPEEYEAAGVPFAERGRRLDDTLRACRALWRDAPASFESETVRFRALWCEPRPAREGGIPIWLGLRASPRNAARLAELGEGWMPLGLDADALAEGADAMRRAFAEAGRDPATLRISVSVPAALDSRGRADLERTLEALPGLRAAGATEVSFPLARFARDADAVPAFLERLARLTR
jgi:probable F420-dependent oxidoreductase